MIDFIKKVLAVIVIILGVIIMLWLFSIFIIANIKPMNPSQNLGSEKAGKFYENNETVIADINSRYYKVLLNDVGIKSASLNNDA